MSFFGSRRQIESPVEPVIEKTHLPELTAPSSPIGFETVLGANSTFEGSFHTNANVRIDGAFTGTLEINGNLLVGETANIKADVNARNISIAGAVRGNVTGKKVQLLRTGRVWGDIRATALTTEEGAFIDGKITMIGHEASASQVDTQPDMPQTVYDVDVAAPDQSDASSETEDPVG
jgi:cytoskeletal protein CcmA (bactofilin family)